MLGVGCTLFGVLAAVTAYAYYRGASWARSHYRRNQFILAPGVIVGLWPGSIILLTAGIAMLLPPQLSRVGNVLIAICVLASIVLIFVVVIWHPRRARPAWMR